MRKKLKFDDIELSLNVNNVKEIQKVLDSILVTAKLMEYRVQSSKRVGLVSDIYIIGKKDIGMHIDPNDDTSIAFYCKKNSELEHFLLYRESEGERSLIDKLNSLLGWL